MLELIKVENLLTQKLVYEIYQGNSYYFSKTTEIIPTLNDVIEDSLLLPPNVSTKQKKYCLLKYENEFVGVIDLIENYPNDGTNYIGLFMIHTNYQGKGYGTRILEELFELFKKDNINKVRLAVISENEKAFNFWKRQDFSIIEEKVIQLTEKVNKKGFVMEKQVTI